MTTIAFRDGLMAADSLAYGGSRQTPPGTKDKTHRLSAGAGRFANALVGISSSNVGATESLMPWLEAGAPVDHELKFMPTDFEILVVTPAGEVFLAFDNLAFTGPIRAEFYAIGGGKDLALGAMAMGASADKAVEVACELDTWTRGPIRVLALTNA